VPKKIYEESPYQIFYHGVTGHPSGVRVRGPQIFTHQFSLTLNSFCLVLLFVRDFYPLHTWISVDNLMIKDIRNVVSYRHTWISADNDERSGKCWQAYLDFSMMKDKVNVDRLTRISVDRYFWISADIDKRNGIFQVKNWSLPSILFQSLHCYVAFYFHLDLKYYTTLDWTGAILTPFKPSNFHLGMPNNFSTLPSLGPHFATNELQVPKRKSD